VESTVSALRTMLDLGKSTTTILHHGALLSLSSVSTAAARAGWQPPILKTIASEGKGIDEVLQAVAQHRTYLAEHPEGQQRARMRAAIELETILRESLLQRLLSRIAAADLERTIEQVAARRIDPYSAAAQLQQI
jgi:LAO/AO transport system kinase